MPKSWLAPSPKIFAGTVTVGSTIWAAGNVSTAGYFVEKAEDYGKEFKWSAARGISSAYDWEAWNSATTPSGTGSDGSACPYGWRLPTAHEIADLIGYTGTISGAHVGTVMANGGINAEYNGIKGFAFHGIEGWLFVPYAGYSGGYQVGSEGRYWSSTEYGTTYAYLLVIEARYTYGTLSNLGKPNTSSVRCVRSK